MKVTPYAVSVNNSEVEPGPSNGCHYVRIKDVPYGVSGGQVIILFAHTAKKRFEEEGRYEFVFSELR